jgi:hypothetical protein
MKKCTVVLVVLLTLLFAGQAFGQTRLPQKEIFIGGAIPLGPDYFKDYYKIGFSGHGQYVIFPSPNLGISFGAAYERFTFDGDKYLSDFADFYGVSIDGVEVTGSASIIELGVGLRPYLTPPEMGTQFFIFGMGTFNFITDEATITEMGISYGGDNTFSKIGVSGGAGLEIPAGESMNIIMQGLVRFIFTDEDPTSFITVTLGLAF